MMTYKTKRWPLKLKATESPSLPSEDDVKISYVVIIHTDTHTKSNLIGYYPKYKMSKKFAFGDTRTDGNKKSLLFEDIQISIQDARILSSIITPRGWKHVFISRWRLPRIHQPNNFFQPLQANQGPSI